MHISFVIFTKKKKNAELHVMHLLTIKNGHKEIIQLPLRIFQNKLSKM